MPKHVGVRKGCNIVYGPIIGKTWLVTLALGLGIRIFKLQTSQIKKEGADWFEPVLNAHTPLSSQSHPNIFIYLSSTL